MTARSPSTRSGRSLVNEVAREIADWRRAWRKLGSDPSLDTLDEARSVNLHEGWRVRLTDAELIAAYRRSTRLLAQRAAQPSEEA